MTKLFKLTIAALLLFSVQLNLFAQDTDIADEDITAYAKLILMVDSMKTIAKSEFSNMVKSHELMDEGRRYTELKKAIGNEDTLEEINATEEEVTAYNDLIAKNTQSSKKIKAAFDAKVKEGLGAKKYNIIKKGLKSDEEMKAKYEAVLTGLKELKTEETEETN